MTLAPSVMRSFGMIELKVRNPVAELNSKPTPRAARVGDLDGIDLGLWWNKKIGGEVALEFYGDELRRQFAVTTHQLYDSFPAHKGMTDKAAEVSKAVIGATGD
jgi:hypothetical protein